MEAACQALEEAPCGNTVRSYLQAYLLGDIAALEEMCNAALVSRLPDRIRGQDHDIGIDLHYIPYHGEPDEDEGELRDGGSVHHRLFLLRVVPFCARKRLTLFPTLTLGP